MEAAPARVGREAAIVTAIVLLAVAIRLPALAGDGLWRDQANVYVQLAAPGFAEFFHRVTSTEWHPPLYFLLAYAWSKIAGSSELALEAIPFACSILTVWFVYRLAKSVASSAAGAIAAGLYAVAPLAVAYSGEYVYPLMGLLATGLAWLVVCSSRAPLTPARFAAIAGLASLVVFTHYTALLFLPLLVAWVLMSRVRLRRRCAIAAALVGGALPFVFWLPIFFTQRNIGVPYRSAASGVERLVIFTKLLAQFAPVRTPALEIAFAGLIVAAFVILTRARAVAFAPLAPATIFLAMLVAVAAQNLSASRYALPYFGLACASLGWLFARAGQLAQLTDPAACGRWGRAAAAVLAAVIILADAVDAVGAERTPKSGIRAIVHRPALDAVTLYVVAPDYLASTFAYYARDARAESAGFVRWERPEIFVLANYAADWNRPDAVDRTLRQIAAATGRKRILDLITDDFARDGGSVPYSRVGQLLRALRGRYRLLDRTPHPGRYEAVSEYRFALESRTADRM